MPSVTVPQQVLAAYEFPGTPVNIGRYGQGHINDTFCITCQIPAGDHIRFILQGLSTAAFPQPEKVMENFVRITDFLRGKSLLQGAIPTGRLWVSSKPGTAGISLPMTREKSGG